MHKYGGPFVFEKGIINMKDNPKPYLPVDEQIKLLQSRGLIINNYDQAYRVLENNNYYRLSGYSLPLREHDKFYPNVSFSDLMDLYLFDADMQAVSMNHLAPIEIALRTHIAYVLGEINPYAHLDKTCFENDIYYEEFLQDLKAAVSESNNEAFIKHHNTKYSGRLPIWVVVEILSFGELSKLFEHLNYDLQKKICDNYYDGIPPKYICNWFHSLVVVRNLCAHRMRLGNRGIPTVPAFETKEFDYYVANGYEKNEVGKRLFFSFVIMQRVTPNINFINDIKSDIKHLCDKYPFVNLKHYGFKNNWERIFDSVCKGNYHEEV